MANSPHGLGLYKVTANASEMLGFFYEGLMNLYSISATVWWMLLVAFFFSFHLVNPDKFTIMGVK